MLTIPEFAQPVLGSFFPVFYHPTYQRFLVLLLGAILTTGRRTVSNLLRTVDGLARGDASSFHRVLSKRRWSTLALARILSRLILDRWVPDGPIMVAGDDTVEADAAGADEAATPGGVPFDFDQATGPDSSADDQGIRANATAADNPSSRA